MNKLRITGNTYNCRDLIKMKGGKWDSASKSWIIDAAAWSRLAALDCGRAVRGCVATPVVVENAAGGGVCPHCGTYCYGDCMA